MRCELSLVHGPKSDSDTLGSLGSLGSLGPTRGTEAHQSGQEGNCSYRDRCSTWLSFGTDHSPRVAEDEYDEEQPDESLGQMTARASLLTPLGRNLCSGNQQQSRNPRMEMLMEVE